MNGHDWSTLKTKRDAYIKRLNGIYERNLDNKGVTYLQGAGRFVDEHTVAVGDTLFSVLNTKNGAAFLYVVATQIPLVLIGLVAGAIYFFDQTKRGSQ